MEIIAEKFENIERLYNNNENHINSIHFYHEFENICDYNEIDINKHFFKIKINYNYDKNKILKIYFNYIKCNCAKYDSYYSLLMLFNSICNELNLIFENVYDFITLYDIFSNYKFKKYNIFKSILADNQYSVEIRFKNFKLYILYGDICHKHV